MRNRLVLCVNSILLPPYDFPLFFLPICILLCRICGFCDILSNAMRYLRNFSEFVIWYYCDEQENHLFNSQNQWQSSLICRISFDRRASQGTEQLCNISHKHRYMEDCGSCVIAKKKADPRLFYCNTNFLLLPYAKGTVYTAPLYHLSSHALNLPLQWMIFL